jgi:hypothetical protein
MQQLTVAAQPTFGDLLPAFGAPDVEGDFKTDDEDPLVNLTCSVPQGMLTMVLQTGIDEGTTTTIRPGLDVEH